jgi:3-oxoacyl-[acyl-carrier protein] reductase
MARVSGLRERVVLLTGAAGGIGSALARRLAADGARLTLAYGHDAAGASRLAGELRAGGAEVVTAGADLADPGAARRLVRAAEDGLGPVDVLVNNAGYSRPLHWPDVDLETWDRTHAINLRAPFLLTQLVLPGMVERRFGRILYVSSVAAYVGGVVGPHYASSKAGLHGLVHYFAGRTAKHAVTVNGLAPALIAETGMFPRPAEDAAAPPLPIPVGRLGTPEEVADLALAVLRNGYLTNQVLLLDGGIHPQ